MENKIQKIIDKARPFIQMHGGDVFLEGIEDGVVKLKVAGACAGCSLSHLTYDKMLGDEIKKEVPEVKKIIINN